MERKFTDDEIVRALECCLADRVICDKCPIQRECESNPFDATLARYSLDLINRQKAEIERLKEADAIYEETTGLKLARTEAIKEFAERLKGKLFYECGDINFSETGEIRRIIDTLVKEMVGD